MDEAVLTGFTDTPPPTADVVVIGGGVIGSSVAYHLTAAGCRDVVVLEREVLPGLGSTGRATGGVRAQFADPVDVRLSRYSIDVLRHFADLTGVDAGYRPNGYMFLALEPASMATLRRQVEMQRGEGIDDVRLIDRTDARAIAPALRVDDVVGGTFCARDGFVDPLCILDGFSGQARRRGACVCVDAAVTAVRRDGAGIAAVETTRGSVATRQVVIAAGAWSAAVGALAGVALPIAPHRRQVAGTQPLPAIDDAMPMVIELESGFHFRKDHLGGGGLLLLWGGGQAESDQLTTFDLGWLARVLPMARHRLPSLGETLISPRRCWTGLYEMTPDGHPIVGPVPAVAGLFVAAGFSGHGVMHSPAAGRAIADLMLTGRSPVIDVDALSLARFAGNAPIVPVAAL